jgi:hypothetical protein
MLALGHRQPRTEVGSRRRSALDPSVIETYQVMMLPGSSLFRPQEIRTLVSVRWATFAAPSETLVVCTSTALENMKIADASGVNQRRLTWVVLAGFAVALVWGAYATMVGIYHHGYFGTGAGAAPYWPSMQSRHDGGLIMQYLTTPSPLDVDGAAAFLGGGAVVVLVGLLRLRLWWWPFHPVGYVIANSWGMHWYLVPFLIGWVSKTLVLRYGGLRLYRLTYPIAIGFIAGDMLNRAIWSVLAVASGGTLTSVGGV